MSTPESLYDSAGNCSLYISDININEGDEIAKIIENEDMIVSDFSCWLEFETDILECVLNTWVDGDSYMKLYDINNKGYSVHEADSVDQTNSDGYFS